MIHLRDANEILVKNVWKSSKDNKLEPQNLTVKQIERICLNNQLSHKGSEKRGFMQKKKHSEESSSSQEQNQEDQQEGNKKPYLKKSGTKK